MQDFIHPQYALLTQLAKPRYELVEKKNFNSSLHPLRKMKRNKDTLNLQTCQQQRRELNSPLVETPPGDCLQTGVLGSQDAVGVVFLLIVEGKTKARNGGVKWKEARRW